MKYRGYEAEIKFDAEDRLFYGRVLGLRDIVSFHGESVDELEAAFRDAIDDYLEDCAERGVKPEKPYSGRLLLRIAPALHREAALAAERAGASLNDFLSTAIAQAIRTAPVQHELVQSLRTYAAATAFKYTTELTARVSQIATTTQSPPGGEPVKNIQWAAEPKSESSKVH
jgi:predicted HicB family RNase H-like nuclease